MRQATRHTPSTRTGSTHPYSFQGRRLHGLVNVRLDAILEMIVMLFQVCGVVAFLPDPAGPGRAWGGRGRVVFIIAMVAGARRVRRLSS